MTNILSVVNHELGIMVELNFKLSFGCLLTFASNLFRLALKAFTDQKKRFFPHLDDRPNDESTEPASKKHCGSQALPPSNHEELSDCKTLSDVLMRLEKEVPNLKIFTYERLDWLKRASSLPSSANESPLELLKEHSFHSSSKLRPGLQNTAAADKVAVDKVAVLELLFPSVFRAIVSLHPVGSIEPDAVAFFSPDEVILFLYARTYNFLWHFLFLPFLLVLKVSFTANSSKYITCDH